MDKLKDHEFKKDDITFTFFDVKLKGEAEMSLRKAKLILIYRYDGEIKVRGETKLDECEASFKFKDIN